MCKYIVFIVVLMTLSLHQGCNDIFEKDISDDTVFVLAPPDGLVSKNYTHTFWWDPVDGAEFYNLTVVSPSFDQINRLVVDTVITKLMFQLSLFPGNFEWSINASNYSSSTVYTVYSLTIEETTDLTEEQVVLKLPMDNSATNAKKVLFQWYPNNKAAHYIFEIRQDNWEGTMVVNPHETEYDTVTLSLPEGKYVWGVQMKNSDSESGFTTRNIEVDFTSPGVPTLLSPENEEEITDTPVTLTWQNAQDTGSPLKDSVLISNDSIFSPAKIIEETMVSGSSYEMLTETAGTYYWKVKTIDAAGNKSEYSVIRKYTIK